MMELRIEENKIVSVKDNIKNEISVFYSKMYNEILQVNSKYANSTSSYNRIFNIYDLIYTGNTELLNDFINKMKIDQIFIKTTYMVDEKMTNYLIPKVTFIQGNEVINYDKLYLKRLSEKYNCKINIHLYEYIKKQIGNYIIDKYKHKLKTIKNGELEKLQHMVYYNGYNILMRLKQNKLYAGEYWLINNECEVEKLEIELNSVELSSIKIIKEVQTNNISEGSIYSMLEEFKVVMISPFSFGKSTVLNGIMGREILKTDLRAETATITKIININNKNILCKYNNKNQENITYLDIEDLKDKLENITSARKEGNNLEEIDIFYEVEHLKGITLIDSPGLFSRYEHHNDISFKAMEEGDLVMFVLDPIKIGEKNFTNILKNNLDKLIDKGKNICFVITKLDLYQEDYNKILKEMNIILENIGFSYIKVFFISGYFALKSILLRDNLIDIKDIQKDRYLFINEEGFRVSGKGLKKEHWKEMFEYSGMEEVIKYIHEVKEIYKWKN